ncbi:terminus macrodomain insulation protein YfbV [Orbaceae bacterium ESL0727]|nr:terminus macrodomain insulation protein YfbV [Orbaceae bacterium ESL0727]
MNIVKIFKSGQQYMHLCPPDKTLAASFPEIKIIAYIKLASKYLPPIVVSLFVWQYYMHASMAITLITALFTLSLPIQGLFWLGKRALSPLPLNLVAMYNKLTQQLTQKNILSKQSVSPDKLNFIEFIKLLNLAKLHLGSYFGANEDDEHDNNSFIDKT